MRCARPVRSGFFPLDEELALLPGQLTPRLHESLVRLGTWLPFAQAAEALAFFTGVTVSEPTVRRMTEGAGAAYEAVQTAAVDAIEEELPPASPGPRVQLLSVDGAMVPLLHHEWAEVKTVAIGAVGQPVREGAEWVVHTEELSYFSRLTDAETFGRLALVETHRRGTETARTVCAVSDGAVWIQGFVDLHRPDAVRILDFPHALGYVAQAGQAVYGEGTEACMQWFTRQRQALQHGDPEEVLRALRQLATVKQRARAPARATVQASLDYLQKRRGMLDYAWFQARGYPIGSGSVESANKLVVERRLKGAGMHWARAHVNPMVALRTVACSDRWAEAWPQIVQHVRQHAWQRRVPPCKCTRSGHLSALSSSQPAQSTESLPPAPAKGATQRAPALAPTRPPTAQTPYRPPPEHSRQRSRLGRTSSHSPVAACTAKL
jgi:hypothetical protein